MKIIIRLMVIFSFLSLLPGCLHASVPLNLLADSGGTYRTHNQMIEMYKNECDKYSSVTSYEVIGKTSQDHDIWAFKIGNPKGSKVIIDGCLHGWEDLGSELTFIWIKWLLESNDPKAKKILKENCWIVIPVINVDTYNRGNMNHTVCSGGVDLNRNFLKGWVFVPACDGPFGTSCGVSAGSEKETQVMRTFMKANKPSAHKKAAYINTHYGGGPWIHYNGSNSSYYESLRNKIIDFWTAKGIVLKNITVDQYLPEVRKNPANGGAAGDAADFGYEAFTVETLARSCVKGHKFGPVDATCGGQERSAYRLSPEQLQNDLFPILKPFFLIVSESVSSRKYR